MNECGDLLSRKHFAVALLLFLGPHLLWSLKVVTTLWLAPCPSTSMELNVPLPPYQIICDTLTDILNLNLPYDLLFTLLLSLSLPFLYLHLLSLCKMIPQYYFQPTPV